MATVERKLQIRSSSIISYKRFSGHSLLRTDKQKQSGDLLKERKTYTGKLCPGAKKRLIKAIELLVQTTKRTYITNPYTLEKMPFQIAFTTLTVHSPDRNITQKEAYKNLLGPFLQWLRRVHKCNLYIWKAELQQRGQIHYHLLLGSFIPHEEIRKKWNYLQQINGYLNVYFEDHGHFNAPSTEIKNALEHDDVAGYLIKEVAKGIQNVDSVHGKVWDCSMNLKEMTYFEADEMKYRGFLANLIQQQKLTAVYTDHCVIYKAKNFKCHDLLDRFDTFLYKDHLDYVKTGEIQRKQAERESKIEVLKPPKKINFRIQYNLFSKS